MTVIMSNVAIECLKIRLTNKQRAITNRAITVVEVSAKKRYSEIVKKLSWSPCSTNKGYKKVPCLPNIALIPKAVASPQNITKPYTTTALQNLLWMMVLFSTVEYIKN